MPKIKFFHEKIAPDAFASGDNPDTGLTVIISGSRINADIGDDLVVYPDISLIARAADKLVVIDLDTVVFPEVGLELSLPRIARGRGLGRFGGLRRFGGLGGGPGFALTGCVAGTEAAGMLTVLSYPPQAVTEKAAISMITSANAMAGMCFADIFMSPLRELR